MGVWAGADLLTNQRGAPRVVFHRKGRLALPRQNTVVPIKTIDISASGIGVYAPEPLPEKQICMLQVVTLHNGEPQELSVKGVIAYCILSGTQGFRVGIQYTELDSATRGFIDRIIETGI